MSFDQVRVELTSHWGGDRDAANSAWASSNDKEKLTSKTDDDVRRLVTNLVNLEHNTPKERVWLEFFITLPIFCERELDKYRLSLQFQDFTVECNVGEFGRQGMTQNELSARYRTLPERSYGLPNDVADIMTKAFKHNHLIIYNNREAIKSDWNYQLEKQYRNYKQNLDYLKKAETEGAITNAEYKRAREVLRGELGTAYLTDMRLVLNMHAFEHILNQRLAKDAQNEIRMVAYHMFKEVEKAQVCPVMLTGMMTKNGWDVLIKDIESVLESEKCVPPVKK